MSAHPHPGTTPSAPAVLADLEALTSRAASLVATGRRAVLGLAGPPGSGKSTLAEQLCVRLTAHGTRVVVVGMDGFHLDDHELLRLGRRDRKGAPDTFDVRGYVALLRRLRDDVAHTVHAPRFDRATETAVAGAVAVEPGTELVITEGNYLLLTEPGWCDVAPELDEVWYVEVPAAERERRLVHRRRGDGEDEATATAWVRGVDATNAATVETSASRATLHVTPPDPGHPLVPDRPDDDHQEQR